MRAITLQSIQPDPLIAVAPAPPYATHAYLGRLQLLEQKKLLLGETDVDVPLLIEHGVVSVPDDVVVQCIREGNITHIALGWASGEFDMLLTRPVDGRWRARANDMVTIHFTSNVFVTITV